MLVALTEAMALQSAPHPDIAIADRLCRRAHEDLKRQYRFVIDPEAKDNPIHPSAAPAISTAIPDLQVIVLHRDAANRVFVCGAPQLIGADRGARAKRGGGPVPPARPRPLSQPRPPVVGLRLALRLDLPKDDLEGFLAHRGALHFGADCPKPLRLAVARQLVKDRIEAAKLGPVLPGQAEQLTAHVRRLGGRMPPSGWRRTAKRS